MIMRTQLTRTLIAAFAAVYPFTGTGAADMSPRPGLTVVPDPGSVGDLLEHGRNGTNIVHGLVRNAGAVDALHAGLLTAGRTGPVTVSVWDGVAVAENILFIAGSNGCLYRLR
jgi:hypothetical protein